MKKLSSTTVYQLSLEDLKEALTLYMAHKYNTEIDIQTLTETMKTRDDTFGYDCSLYLDGITIYSNI